VNIAQKTDWPGDFRVHKTRGKLQGMVDAAAADLVSRAGEKRSA